MAVAKRRGKPGAKSNTRNFDIRNVVAWVKSLMFDPQNTWIVALLLLVAECAVNVLVILKIKCELFYFLCVIFCMA